jgi:hypothetical protein
MIVPKPSGYLARHRLSKPRSDTVVQHASQRKGPAIGI